MKVAIIGAGLSGLAAAFRLQNLGHEVVVIEAENRPGGRCKALHRDGFVIDTCPELAATSYRRWLALIDDAGLKGELVKCPSTISVLKGGRLIDIDMGNPASLALTSVLSWRAKLRLAHGVWKLRKKIMAVPHYLLDDVSLDDPDINAEALSLASFGQEVTDMLINPLLRPIGGVSLDMMSSMLLPYTLSDWTQMVTLRGGLERLPITVARHLNVHYQTCVTKVLSDAAGVTLQLKDHAGQLHNLQADKCLITVPYDLAEAMYPRFEELSRGYRHGLQYMRMLDIKLAYGKRAASRAAMVMIPYKENPRLNVISLSHNKSPDRAPADHSLFSIFTEHRDYEQMAARSDADIVAMMRAEIERLYPEVRGHFQFSHLSRQVRVSYIPDAGFFRRTRILWDHIGQDPRVQLGGDLFMFGGMEAAVASGERAALRLVR